MSRLRKKLGDNDQLIKTVRNGGYMFSTRVETIGADS
jgi:two-component system OmpR family response regulator